MFCPFSINNLFYLKSKAMLSLISAYLMDVEEDFSNSLNCLKLLENNDTEKYLAF